MNTKYFQSRLARLHELANPVEEYRDERVASKRKLKENSQLRKGKVIGVGLGALAGASVVKQAGYGVREIARGAAGPGGRRTVAALIGVPAVAGAAVGGAIGARMRKKKKELSARLHEFVSLVREQRGDCGGLYCGDVDHGPTMYVSGVEDPALMAMEKEGVATVRYKIRSRSVNERGDEPTYGADISISSIEPVKSPKKELSVLERLREFAAPGRSVTKLIKTSKRNPWGIRKTDGGEFRVALKGSAKAGPQGYYTNDIKDARNTTAGILKKERAQSKAAGAAALRKKVDRMETGGGNRPDLGRNARPNWAQEMNNNNFSARVKNFADRERNQGGQFISGVAANPDDMAMAYKKKVGKIAGAAVAGTGVAMAATPGGRKVMGRVGQSVMRGAGRALMR